jgi:hypothetical protein
MLQQCAIAKRLRHVLFDNVDLLLFKILPSTEAQSTYVLRHHLFRLNALVKIPCCGLHGQDCVCELIQLVIYNLCIWGWVQFCARGVNKAKTHVVCILHL